MSTFETTSLFLLANEGGFTDDKYDAGGVTNFGITTADYSDYLGRPATRNDMRAMTKAVALKILKSMYWSDNFSQLPQSVATVLTDWRLLHGVGSASMMAQKAANELGCHLNVDGDIGPATIKALNELRPAYFIAQFKKDIMSYFDYIVAHNPTQRVFLDGWKARINRYSNLV